VKSRGFAIAALAVASLGSIGAPTSAAARVQTGRALFRVALVATVNTGWLRNVSYTQDGCHFEGTNEGGGGLSLSSAHSTLVPVARSADGVHYLARSLTSLGGASAAGEYTGTARADDCGRAIHWDGYRVERNFSRATVDLLRPSKGRLQLSGVRLDGTLETGWDPQELGGSGSPPVEIAVGRIDERKLFDPRVGKMVVRATRTQDHNTAAGTLSQRVLWQLVFRRVRA
jgi:hypothetical protein